MEKKWKAGSFGHCTAFIRTTYNYPYRKENMRWCCAGCFGRTSSAINSDAVIAPKGKPQDPG
jgi:hypothetical protein